MGNASELCDTQKDKTKESNTALVIHISQLQDKTYNLTILGKNEEK